MLIRTLIAAALCAGVATGALAQEPSSTDQAKPAKEKKVCRRGTETGSITPSSTCHTKAEWAQIDQQNQAGVDQFAASRHQSTGRR